MNRKFRICSVPCTGTRFVQSFFLYLAEAAQPCSYVPDCYHTHDDRPMRDDDFKLVIPKRHPYLCYESMIRTDRFGIKDHPELFVLYWQRLIDYADSRPSILFPIDRKSVKLEKQVCDFVDIPWHEGFGWQAVGGSRGRTKLTRPNDKVVKEIQFAVEWFDALSR